jgi:hypothetical protein
MRSCTSGQHVPFRPTGRKVRAKESNLWSRTFRQPSAHESAEVTDLLANIDKQWAHFVEHGLPPLVDATTAEEWLQNGEHAPPTPPAIASLSIVTWSPPPARGDWIRPDAFLTPARCARYRRGMHGAASRGCCDGRADKHGIVVQVLEHGGRRVMLEQVRPGQRVQLEQDTIAPFGFHPVHAGRGGNHRVACWRVIGQNRSCLRSPQRPSKCGSRA